MVSTSTTLFVTDTVLYDCRAQLQILYNAGARKFIVFGLPAIEQIPVINVANRIINLIDAGKTLPQDGILAYAKRLSVRATMPQTQSSWKCLAAYCTFQLYDVHLWLTRVVFLHAAQVDIDTQIQAAAKAFQAANPVAAVDFFDFAAAQRGYKANGGFVDTVNACEFLPSATGAFAVISIASYKRRTAIKGMHVRLACSLPVGLHRAGCYTIIPICVMLPAYDLRKLNRFSIDCGEQASKE